MQPAGAVVVYTLLTAVIVALALFPGWRVNERVVARWARSAGLTLSADGRAAAATYLRWSKRGRTAGGLLGLAIPYVVWLLTGTPGSTPYPVGYILLGYVLGGLVAEVALRRPGRSMAGAALVVPRRLPDYLSPRLLALQRGLGIVSVVLAVGYAFSPFGADPSRPRVAGDLTGLLLLGLAGLAAAVIAEGLQRVIVNRRQSIAGDEDAQLDDATRSHSVQALAGAALAVLCYVVASEISMYAAALGQWPLAVLAFVLLGATLYFWVGLAEPRRLRIRRLAGLRSRA